ncbi:MAG: hypothetical protein IPM58_11815 [Nitrospira sp.]|nr:hypothetical protein [Nitrospira sp.]
MMIVEPNLDFGIKLADWLATHGYQAVLVRTVERAIDECRDLNPQGVFIGPSPVEPVSQIQLRRLLHMLETMYPGVSVVTSGCIRHVLVAPIDPADIGYLLQAELNRTPESTRSPNATLTPAGEGPVERLLQGRAFDTEAATWIR